METERLYRRVFYTGGVWNFLVSVPIFFLVSSLPSLLEIDPPTYPIFIYFNLMTVFLFGWIHFVVARNPFESRPYVRILFWSKVLTVLIFAGGLVLIPMPPNLIGFLAPGMVIDLIFGLIFLRCLIFSARTQAIGPAASN